MTGRAVHLAPVERAVLYQIARYRFINVELLTRVVAATRQTIRDAARRLAVLGLIGSTAPKAHKLDDDGRREFGKPALFWVSHDGARFLARERLSDPLAPLVVGSDRRTNEPKHIQHRLGIVAVHMAFRAWAEATGKVGVSFLCDFEPGGRGQEKITGVPYQYQGKRLWYRPDGFARFRLAPGAPQQLLVLEFERGGAGHDPSPFFTFKLDGIRRAAKLDAVENAKQRDVPPAQRRAYPYLVVFPSETMRDRALDLWPDPLSPEWRRFFIKALPELDAPGADFSAGWWRPDRTRPGMYQEPA